MLKTIEVVFDGKAFVPTEPVDLPAGTKASIAVDSPTAASNAPLSHEEAERILRGDGSPLPWATVDEALAYSRGREWSEPGSRAQP